MYFAWKDDNFSIKILTTIMIFIVVMLVAISPAFAYDGVVINDTEYELSDFLKQFDKIILYKSSSYVSIVATNSDYLVSGVSNGENGITFNASTDTPVYTYYANGSSSVSSFYNNLSSFIESNFDVVTNSGFIQSSRYNSNNIVYTSFDLYSYDNSLISSAGGTTTNFISPSFMTSDSDLCSGKFDTLKIDMGDMDYDDDTIILNIYDNFDMGDGVYSNYKKKSIMLENSSPYRYVSNLNVFFYIPQANLGIDISNDKRYTFELASYDGETVYDTVTFQIGGLTLEEEIKNEQDEQTEAIKENTETNKGIWETIKDILSYINPFSENFFVYKLISLLVDAIKSLFIPSDDFFSTYFTNLQNWFSDRLGFLFYPFELIIDILNDILNIDFSEPQFNIPDINEPFTGKKLISATTFNFNDLLDNSVWNTVHNIYLILVDAAIVFGLVNLFHKKYEEVTTK